jgi:DNA-binding transcriptional regulator YdaS (Cro superfamily)
MDFRLYFAALDPHEKRALASRLGTSVAYLSQIAYRHRRAGFKLAQDIEAETGQRVTCQNLRPDIWGPPPGERAASLEPELEAVD